MGKVGVVVRGEVFPDLRYRQFGGLGGVNPDGLSGTLRQRPSTGARSSVMFENHPCVEAIACQDASEADEGR
jgi:hypothetical protein